MKIVNMVCPNCGASIQVDADKKNLTCNYCGNNLYLDDEVQHVQYDNAEETGYQFEKGRQRAQSEARQFSAQQYGAPVQQKPKKKTWLWVLGWIFIFPLPLTILLVRKKHMNAVLKYGIIAVAWIFYLIIALSGKPSDNSNNQSTSEGTVASADTENPSTDNKVADSERSVTETVESEQMTSEDPLADFYAEFLQSGTVGNIKELAKKYGLYADSRKTGTGRELFKVAETYDEARVTSNTDEYKGDYYVRIECTILGDDTVDSVELVDNRNGEASETSTDKEVTADDMYALIADFIEEYNSVADNKITNPTNYDIHEEHYRTEYRLQAFNESVGTFGEATDSTFEIVASKPGMFSDGALTYHNLRIYGSFNDADSAKKALETIVPIIDSSITVEKIQAEYSEYRPDEVSTFIKGDSGDVTFYIKHAPSNSAYKFDLFID
ncbi:hypothetical protein SAMN04487771_10659 [[Clostridium] aminophilum]|uniref:Uncharacterized protein n=1 Tax=[Clostridium] aminophilum TaxID=1526 RepID=A0A1I0I1R1_9FIRM|nr:TFIIB-type zinc ribbon-containing protein [[Clostridium] aminophilum]SET90542.1 hypothetical protein SAMN04487771_10659 [[Clostridium] aminophilum]